ncbi:MAG TPA: chromate efflux transporter [Jiangellaceae bacterium]|nr:chromate efflux transporter [Jiangellaceae bacterium]
MRAGPLEVFVVALRLGVTSFGGPIAHLGYFRTEYVQRRRWLDDDAFAELVALGQFLPGPASSQVGMAIGYVRARLPGAVAGWLGFTLPSAVIMAIFGALATGGGVGGDEVWLRALKLVAVAVVLDAVIGMARRLAATWTTARIAVASGAAMLVLPASGLIQVACLLIAAAIGLMFFRVAPTPAADELQVRVPRRAGAAALTTFVALLALLPLAAGLGVLAEIADAMYRAGALVFGGGHVVLPLLEAETVPGLVSQADFLAGYGVAQALPGPLFTFGTFLGQVAAGVPGAVVGTLAIFLPGFLILFGVLPFWQQVRSDGRVQAALTAVNAAVVGLLGAAWIDPIVTSSVTSALDAGFAAGLFGALSVLRAPPWLVVVAAVLASPLLGL